MKKRTIAKVTVKHPDSPRLIDVVVPVPVDLDALIESLRTVRGYTFAK